MKTIPTLALLSVIAVPALRAQTAEGFDTSGMVPAAPAAEANAKPQAAPAAAAKQDGPAAAAPAALQAEALKKIPSRYAGTGPELAAYIDAYSSRFGIKRRQTDVFGRNQDPNYVPPQPLGMLNQGPKKPSYKQPVTPFPDVVAAIEVNTIDLANQRFLVGPREFGVNSLLTIKLPTGKTVKALVTKVSSKSITFRNPETGETATKQMALMPPGMSRGISGITAPGMEAIGANAPLEVEVAPPSPPISSK